MRINSYIYTPKTFCTFGAASGQRKRSTKEELIQRKKKVETVLLDAKNNNKTITLEEIAQKTDIPRSSVAKYIANDEALNLIWFWVKPIDPSVFTKEEMQEQSDLIAEQKRLATEQKRTITRTEISKATGIDKGIIKGRFETDAELKKIWQENQAIADKNYNLEVNRIKKALQEAKKSGLKVTYRYISQVTSIAIGTVKARIAQNSTLSRLFDKVRAVEHDAYTEEETLAQNARISAALTEAVESGQKMTFNEFASKLEGLKPGLISSRISRNTELKALWGKVKTGECIIEPQYDIEAKSAEIEQILTEVKSKKETITLSKLAKMVGLAESITAACIKKSQKLSVLWDATLSKPAHNYTEDEIEVHNVMIERILRQRIQDKTKASFYQMAQYLDLSEGYLKKLIRNNPGLSTLFEAAQQPEIQPLPPPENND